LRAAIVYGNADQQIFRRLFRILHKNVKVAVLVEDPGIEKFIFKLLPRATFVRFHQIQVREFALGILVEVLHVGVRGRTVDIEVVLFDVFAVVALAVGKPEKALLQNGIPLVPQGERETEPLAVVGYPGDAVFSPSISPRPGLVVRKIVPGIAVLAVIFTNRTPLPFAEVGYPHLPGYVGFAGFIQALLFRSIGELGSHGKSLLPWCRSGWPAAVLTCCGFWPQENAARILGQRCSPPACLSSMS